jgi:hypothetical protein
VRRIGTDQSSFAPSASAISSCCEASYASADVGFAMSVIAVAESGSDASRATAFARKFRCARCGAGSSAENCLMSARGFVASSSSGMPNTRPMTICHDSFGSRPRS